MRFVIIGSGSIALRHLRNIKSILPNSKVAVLVDKNRFTEKKKDSLSQAQSIIHSKEEAISYAPEAVIICSPASFHIDMAMFYAQNGINIFLEKPLSNNLDGVNQLIEIIKKKKIIAMVGYPLRFNRSLIKFHEKIKQGFIGDILKIRSRSSSYLPKWRPNIDYRKSVSANTKLGGGVILEVSHEIDYLRWIFGEPELIGYYHDKFSSLEIDEDCEDYAIIMMRFHDSMSNSFLGELSLDFFSPIDERFCKVFGSKGILLWNGIENTVSFQNYEHNNHEIIFHQIDFDHNEMYLDEMKHFINCVKLNNESPISIQDGLKTLKMALKVKGL